MKHYLTQSEMDRVEALCRSALDAPNKAAAQEYLTEAQYLVSDVFGPSRNILASAFAAVSNASGQVSDKATKVDVAEQAILKASMFCVGKD